MYGNKLNTNEKLWTFTDIITCVKNKKAVTNACPFALGLSFPKETIKINFEMYVKVTFLS